MTSRDPKAAELPTSEFPMSESSTTQSRPPAADHDRPNQRRRWSRARKLNRYVAGPRIPRVTVTYTLWLFFIWVAAFGNVEPLTLVGGLLVAFIVQWSFPLPLRTGIFVFRPFRALWLAIRFLYDTIRAGLHVSWLVLRPEPRRDAIIAIATRTDNPEYLTILSAMTSLVPGTIVLEVDPVFRYIYLHCLDVDFQGGVEGVRAAVRAQEARILQALAPNSVLIETGLLPVREVPNG